MLKYHNLISLGIGILFLVVLQEFSTPEPVFRFLLPAFCIFALAVTAYNRWYLKKLEKYNFWILLRPLLLLASGFGIFLIIPSSFLRGLFLIVSVLLIALVEYALGNFSENLLINETLLIAFGLFLCITGATLYFPPFTHPYVNLLYVFATFLSGTLLARTFYEFVPQSKRIKLASSLIMGLLASEFFWALSFLPFHFSAKALLLFNFYYFCLIMNYYFFFQTLSQKKLQFHLILVLLGSGLVMLATPWKVIQ